MKKEDINYESEFAEAIRELETARQTEDPAVRESRIKATLAKYRATLQHLADDLADRITEPTTTTPIPQEKPKSLLHKIAGILRHPFSRSDILK